MKVLIINGSPRIGGNNDIAIEQVKKGIAENTEEITVELINLYDNMITMCTHCNICQAAGTCVYDDDMKTILDEVEKADFVLFSTPVWWFNYTDQLKIFFDRLYGDHARFTGKKLGLILIADEAEDHWQYPMIEKQFRAMMGYLGNETVYVNWKPAHDAGDILKHPTAMDEFYEFYKVLQ